MSLITSIAHVLWVVAKSVFVVSMTVTAAVLLLIVVTMAWYRFEYLWARWRWHRAAQRRIKLELLLIKPIKPKRRMKVSLR